AINQWVNANGVMYKVVGVFKDSEDYQTIAYAPFSTVQQIYNKGVSISRLNLVTPGIKTTEDSKWFSTLLRRTLSTVHRFDPKDESAVWIANYAETSGAMNQASVMIHSGLWVLGLLTLLSGITGVSNIMLVSVKERIHEFGIRRAIGAKPRNLIGMVIMESVIITAIFGYIGMVCGIAFTEYLDKFESNKVVEIGDEKNYFFIDPTVDISTCVEATLVIIAAGAIAGFIPAQKAAKVKPIEALREA
ncbi:MAG: FtsX-like permease family protein, partial [Bacteroidaceae bacterium]|nr:FtsX-like permease family protein [Bacteroidaceae bacterium]